MVGKKEWRTLGLAALNGFDVFITLDKNLKNQQNLDKVKIKFIVLLAKDNKHQNLQTYIPRITNILQSDNLQKLNIVSNDE